MFGDSVGINSASPENPDKQSLTRALVVFVVLAFGLSWLIALPLWLGDGMQTRGFSLYLLAMMATPTIAAVVSVLLVERPVRKLQALGITPLQPVGRLIGFSALAVVLVFLLCLLALPMGALFGVYHADFTGLSGFKQLLDEQMRAANLPPIPLSPGVLLALQFLNIAIASLVINVIPALGEEIGWRGWLLPRLVKRFGPWWSIAISGIMWGLWHSPVILLGYNYPDTPGWLSVLAMTAMCTVVGGIFGWLRLRGGSVWPAAFAHSTFNASAGVFALFMAADTQVDTLHASILGWSGWIIPAVLLIVIVLTGQFRAVGETVRPPMTHWPTVEVSTDPLPVKDREFNDESHHSRH
ncbi:MAG: CPBP family intramembrane metalloprotease [Actinomycetaceae bacterium]|nr:CPBP family intramembrane metalloprotease [Actinomycetaceae bacterium]